MSTRARDYDGVGWILFVTIMMTVAGAFNVIDGIVALSKSRFYPADAVYVFSNLRTWGWIILILGVIQLIAAGGIATGSQAARWFGIGAASLSAIGQLLFVPAYPWWSIAMFSIDILIIYGLAAYGGSEGPAGA